MVAIFAGQMLRGEQPTIFGPGDKTRDYTCVFDVVEANLLAMERGEKLICNIGNGIETSDKEMFDTLAGVLGYEGSPRYAPVRKGEVYNVCLECSLARRELGWESRISLHEGLLKSVEYYRQLNAFPGD